MSIHQRARTTPASRGEIVQRRRQPRVPPYFASSAARRFASSMIFAARWVGTSS